jgi:inorganic pyrophosphatase/exopolyphosphatase
VFHSRTLEAWLPSWQGLELKTKVAEDPEVWGIRSAVKETRDLGTKDFVEMGREVKDSETKDSETKDSEIKDSEVKDSEIKDSEVKDSEVKDSEIKDSETKGLEIKDSETKDSEMKEVRLAVVSAVEDLGATVVITAMVMVTVAVVSAAPDSDSEMEGLAAEGVGSKAKPGDNVMTTNCCHFRQFLTTKKMCFS